VAEPFKNLINAGTVERAASALSAADAAFDAKAFQRVALPGLDGLEMKARAMQIADALEATLPADFDRACDVLESSLGDIVDPDSPATDDGAGATGLRGWVIWSLGEFVARRGNGRARDVDRALRCLHALTQRFTAEWALRPFLRDHPDRVLKTLTRWTRDPSAHVRRLVSEGSRPRLPWGLRLQSLVADPSPTLPLLAALQDDDSGYVRRSVANHLNDIAKDHPDVVADWLERWLPDAGAERRTLLRHASRTLIKKGDARVLAAWGHAERYDGRATLRLAEPRVTLGGGCTLEVSLQSTGRTPQTLVVDYCIHHVKAGGHATPKVFKGWNLTLQPGEVRRLEKRHAVKPITTRRYHAGWHKVELLVNGVALAEAGFELML